MKLFRVTFVYVAQDSHTMSTITDPSHMVADTSIIGILSTKSMEVDPHNAEKKQFSTTIIDGHAKVEPKVNSK